MSDHRPFDFGADLELSSWEPPPMPTDGAFADVEPLPMRWDALDGHGAEPRFDPADFDPARVSDEAFARDTRDSFGDSFSNDSFSNDSFSGGDVGTGLALYDDAFDAPEPSGPSALLAPLPSPEGPSTLYDDAFRVCFRLTGVSEIGHELATAAMREPESTGTQTPRVYAVMVAAVHGALARALPDEESIPYHQHRARLRRELARHSERDQAILALRHLVVVPPMAVAARLGLHESVVREVASAWRPEDSRGDSSALLRGIDSWISNDRSDGDIGAATLAHLDEPEHATRR